MQGYPNAYSRSKQNSDAAGMKYQWGRKDSFTFAVTSLRWGTIYDYGKYPVKIYNGKLELIYQEDNGGSNSGKTPVGGVIVQFSSPASSMMETVKKPNLFYYGGSSIISQVGQSKELWDYYWTSYSRGVDGRHSNTSIITTTWHNTYLDGYMVLRTKSIYDPCPYGYRTPTNGTYNDFKSNTGWTLWSYAGGAIWGSTWFNGIGLRSSCFKDFGRGGWYSTSTIQSKTLRYPLVIYYDKRVTYYGGDNHEINRGQTVRCIEDATVKADG